MAKCPRCAGEIMIDAHLTLGPDDFSDDFVWKTLACRRCSLVGAGTYEASRRGSDERWHHQGYELARAAYDAIRADLARCPSPGDKTCACAIHQKYRATTGCHDPFRGLTRIGGPFPLG